MLTVSKRFEFSSSHKYYNKDLSEEENAIVFGDKSRGEFGHGHNYEVWITLSGEVNKKTGMLINVSEIKKTIEPLLAEKYDHKFLNDDTSPFDKILPTPENIAVELLKDAQRLFDEYDLEVVACHLKESDKNSATAYSNGKIERTHSIQFSSARSTRSPLISDEENKKLFGVAASPGGHGHNYTLCVSFEATESNLELENGMIVDDKLVISILDKIKEEFDHKNINLDVAGLDGLPITTESIAKYIFEEISNQVPLAKVRLCENDNFFIVYSPTETLMGITQSFSASHRLYSNQLSIEENEKIFGKCQNKAGHGHDYKVECSLIGEVHSNSGVLFDLVDVNEKLKNILDEYDYKHLDLETEDFKEMPSTGENIVSNLERKLRVVFSSALHNICLWETNNNKFMIE